MTRTETAIQLRDHALAIVRQHGSHWLVGDGSFLMWAPYENERWEIAMANGHELEKELERMLERQMADAQARIQEMTHAIDQRDKLIAELQRRIEELERRPFPEQIADTQAAGVTTAR